jgi:hypothetical protein
MLIIIAFFCSTDIWALASTKGTPIGGMGTGYMIYNAKTGDFATSGKLMPAGSDGDDEFSTKKSASSGFHLFAGTQSKIKATTTNEDAKCPIYTADYGAVDGVTFKLLAFGPYISGEDSVKAQLAQSPLAFFEISATNTSAGAKTVAAAMEFTNKSAGINGLLGGANTGTSAADKHALAYGTAANENAYLLAGCSDAAATYNTGAIGTFATDGNLASGDGNIVSVKTSIPAGATVRFKFVMSWYRQFRNPTRGNEDFWYHNFYANSQASAEFGMSMFDAVKTGCTSIVDRTMASNFPDWYKERLLNNLYPMTHNSQCAKDGRVGFWEGNYPIIGTIDQGQHAALWYINNWPSNQWRELEFWARSQHTGVSEDKELKGQIHHDLNGIDGAGWTTEGHFMFPWDNYLHNDYWFMPNTTEWSDLNGMFIFKAYELMVATGDRQLLTKYWPYIKNTGDRLMIQCGTSHLPLASKSTYDSDKGLAPEYASTTMLTAMNALVEMAKWLKDDASATKYQNWYDAGRAEFKTAVFKDGFGNGKLNSEGDVAGYSWARYYGFPGIMDSNLIATACNRLWTYYISVPNNGLKKGYLGNWHFYTCDHMGGTFIACGRQDTAMTLFKADYDFYHTANPQFVFWQDLWSVNNEYKSYMTAPAAWRSYYQMTGTLLDRANKRLWIRPMVPKSMNGQITNAAIVNPKAWGTLNYTEVVAGTRIQNMTVTFDSDIPVDQIVLKNNTTKLTAGTDLKESILLDNNGTRITDFTAVTEGTGFEKNIRITLPSTIQIGTKGLIVQVFNGPVGVLGKSTKQLYKSTLKQGMIAAGQPIQYTLDNAGEVSFNLFSVNGAKIGQILKSNMVPAGSNHFVWNGKTLSGDVVSSGMAVLQMVTPKSTISRSVIIKR